jgi:hypothetical protein
MRKFENREWVTELAKVRFQVFMAAGTQMAVFWIVAPCSLVEVYLYLLP